MMSDIEVINYRLAMIRSSFQFGDEHGQLPETLARNVYLQGSGQPAPDQLPASLANDFVSDMMQLRNAPTDLSLVSKWRDIFSGKNETVNVPQGIRTESTSHNLNASISHKLNVLRKKIELFLQLSEFLPVWEPPSAWKQASPPGSTVDLQTYLRNLRLPMHPLRSSATPEFLLYRLGCYHSVDAGRLTKRTARLLSGNSHRIVMNTSGSGKSRLLFEALCQLWGLYLTCASDSVSSPYGSRDLTACLEEQFLRTLSPNVQNQLRFDSKAARLKDQSTKKHRDQLEVNDMIVQHVMSAVVLSRLLVLRLFLDVSQSLGITDEPLLKRAWLMLQLFPRLSENGELTGPIDFFEDLTKVCAGLPATVLPGEVRNVASEIPAGKYPRLLVFDEVQSVALKWRSAFSNATLTANRSLLRPIVVGAHSTLNAGRVIIAGTRLFYNDVLNALSSNVFKDDSFTEFADLGGYVRWVEDMRRFLYHVFTPALVDSWPSDIHDNIKFWLSGRHRFLVVPVQHILMQGPHENSVRNVIDNVIFSATGEHLPQYRSLYRPIDGLQIKGLVPRAFLTKSVTAKERVSVRLARKGVLQFLTQMTFPKFDMKRTELVDMGIGRFVINKNKKLHIEINERLVLAALMVLFDSPSLSLSIRAVINEVLSNPTGSESSTGLGFEDAMVYLFWLRFAGDGSLLSDVFDFEPDVRPAWADKKGKLISVFRPGSRMAKDFALRKLTSVLARNVSTCKGSFRWFRNTDGVPFLKPDNLFGPDIIFALQLYDDGAASDDPNQTILVCVQCKNWAKSRGGEEVRSAIFTASPEGFYRSNIAKRNEALKLLKRFKPLSGTLLNRRQVNARLQTLMPCTPAVSSTPSRKKAPASQGKKVNIKYGDKVDFAVLRCLAAFPNTADIDRPVSKQDGIYPLVTINQAVMRQGCEIGFERFRYAMEEAKLAYPERTEEELLEFLNDSFGESIEDVDREEILHANIKSQWEKVKPPEFEGHDDGESEIDDENAGDDGDEEVDAEEPKEDAEEWEDFDEDDLTPAATRAETSTSSPTPDPTHVPGPSSSPSPPSTKAKLKGKAAKRRASASSLNPGQKRKRR